MTSAARHEQFLNDMRDAGFDVNEDYHGRYQYEGPAVTVRDYNELQVGVRATEVEIRWDDMGLGYVVYPK